MTVQPEVVWLLTATALHAGFQLTVTFLVYPALAAIPAADWMEAHRRHSKRIAPLVGLVYLAVVASAVAALLAAPGAAVGTAVAASGTTLARTAFLAAPAHGRLRAGREPVLLRRLLLADRLRSLTALVALASAAVAVLR